MVRKAFRVVRSTPLPRGVACRGVRVNLNLIYHHYNAPMFWFRTQWRKWRRLQSTTRDPSPALTTPRRTIPRPRGVLSVHSHQLPVPEGSAVQKRRQEAARFASRKHRGKRRQAGPNRADPAQEIREFRRYRRPRDGWPFGSLSPRDGVACRRGCREARAHAQGRRWGGSGVGVTESFVCVCLPVHASLSLCCDDLSACDLPRSPNTRPRSVVPSSFSSWYQ